MCHTAANAATYRNEVPMLEYLSPSQLLNLEDSRFVDVKKSITHESSGQASESLLVRTGVSRRHATVDLGCSLEPLIYCMMQEPLTGYPLRLSLHERVNLQVATSYAVD